MPGITGMGPEGIGAYDAATDTIKVSGTVSAGGSAAAAAADAESNATTMSAQRTRLSGFNGTTWDRLRAGLTAVSATLTGFLNVLPWAQFNTAPTTRTTGQGGPLEADASGNLRQVVMNPAVAVDDVNGKIVVEHRYAFTNITTGATTVVKSGAGLLHAIVVNKGAATATITIYDNTAGSGTKIGTITFGAALLTDPPLLATYNLSFSTGLTIVTSGATDVTVVYR